MDVAVIVGRRILRRSTKITFIEYFIKLNHFMTFTKYQSSDVIRSSSPFQGEQKSFVLQFSNHLAIIITLT